MATSLLDERKRARARARRRRRGNSDSLQSATDSYDPMPIGPERQQHALDRQRGGGRDLMVRLQRGHGNAYCNRLIGSRAIARATGTEMIGASSTAMSMKDPRKGHGPIKAGQSNYSRMLLGET